MDRKIDYEDIYGANDESLEEYILDLNERLKKLEAPTIETEEKPKIDWSKMPVDTLVEASDEMITWEKRHFYGLEPRDIMNCYEGPFYLCYRLGASSHTARDPGDYVHSYKYIRLITNPWRPWFGGDMPCCPNVIVEVEHRDGFNRNKGRARIYRWDHQKTNSDIIAYRMLGE